MSEALREYVDDEQLLSFYERIKIKNNIEALFNHYDGAYAVIEIDSYKNTYIIRGKFHVKYGIYAKFQKDFKSLSELREYADFIEAVAFLKTECEESVLPILNDEGDLCFMNKSVLINVDNIKVILERIRKDKKDEINRIEENIKRIYDEIEEIDLDIRNKQRMNKYMEIKIKTVIEAAQSLWTAIKYIAVTHDNSIVNRVRRVFIKPVPVLTEAN